MSTTEPTALPLRSSSVNGGPRTTDNGLFAGLRVVGLLTLLSRVLGLVRDMAMAAAFGNGAVMDAFSVAFRVPNLARRLFGEGAMTAAFLPAFVRELEQSGRESAWRLGSAVLTLLAVVLAAAVLIGELALAAIAWLAVPGPEGQLLLGLTAVMLPYMLLICVASQVSAIQHALGHFTWPALLPVLLNLVWIAVLWLAVRLIPTPAGQVYAVAAGVLAAGVLQLVAPLRALHRLGFRFRTSWGPARPRVAAITRSMVPVLLALSVTQLNTLADGLIAWGFSAPEESVVRGPWSVAENQAPGLSNGPRTTGHGPTYPLPSGTASALYFGQRLYQFPLGVFGVALGTVIFPLLTRHAEAGRFDRLRDDLTLGLRLVVAVALPAGLGLWLLARPLTVLFFQHGAFTADDVAQTAGIVGAYSLGVWAYCAQLLLDRAFYAVNDRMTPLRCGMAAVGLNLALNLALIWPLGGEGLALATSVAAMLQVVLLARSLERRLPSIDWPALSRTLLRTLAASASMVIACRAAQWRLVPSGGRWSQVVVPVAAAVAAYLLAARLFGLEEVRLLLRRERQRETP